MTADVYSGQAVKRAAWQFLSGKAATGVLTFGILLWLVRLFPAADYGAYVVLIAGAELGFSIAGLSLPWLGARYLPEYRLHADGATLRRFCWRLALWQALALLVLASVIALAMDSYLRWADLSRYRAAAWLALGFLVTEGMLRFVCEALLAPLMLQRQVRFVLVLRQVAFLVTIAVLSVTGFAQVPWVMAGQLVTSLLAWLLASVAVLQHLRALKGQRQAASWQEPRVVEPWRIALRMHGAYLMTLATGPQVFLNLVQRTLGAESAALLGFLQTLHRQIVSYLPATLFFSVLRPKLMAGFVTGGMPALASQANLAGKLSLFALMPLIVLVALGGDLLVTLASGGKFTQGGALLFGLMLVLVPFSQRQLIESVAVGANRSSLCTLGSALSLLSLPLMLSLLSAGYGLWAPVIAMLAAQVGFNATVTLGLAPLGYQPDWRGAVKLAGSGLLAWLVSNWAAGIVTEHPLRSVELAIIVAVPTYLFLAWWLEPFTTAERSRINAMAGRRIFVW